MIVGLFSMPALPPLNSAFRLPYYSHDLDSVPEFKVIKIETILNRDARDKVYACGPGQPIKKIYEPDLICEHMVHIEPVGRVSTIVNRRLVSEDSTTRSFLMKKLKPWDVYDHDVEDLFKNLIFFNKLILPFRICIDRDESNWEAYHVLNTWLEKLRNQ